MSQLGKNKNKIEILVIAVSIASIVAFYHVPLRYGYDLLFLLPTFGLILCFALLNEQKGFISKLLSNAYITKLGNCSFTFYMIHILGISVLAKIYWHIGIQNAVIIILSDIILITLLSIMISRYYENPIASKILTMIKKKQLNTVS